MRIIPVEEGGLAFYKEWYGTYIFADTFKQLDEVLSKNPDKGNEDEGQKYLIEEFEVDKMDN